MWHVEEEDTEAKVDNVECGKVEDAVGKVKKVNDGKVNHEAVCADASKQEDDDPCMHARR